MILKYFNCSSPLIVLCSPISPTYPESFFAAAFCKTSMIKEDLPEPLTPVTTVRQPFGMSTEMSLRLFALAFEIEREFVALRNPNFLCVLFGHFRADAAVDPNGTLQLLNLVVELAAERLLLGEHMLELEVALLQRA